MFGNSGNQFTHLVNRHQWDRINKKLPGADAKAKIALATACGQSSADEAAMVLINLIKDPDESVQLQAVKSLGLVGQENAKTSLQWLSNNLEGDKKEVREAIGEALQQIINRKD